MIAVGSKIPSVSIKQATPEGGTDVDPAALFAGKKVVMFSLPGAFTPTCSQKHLPGYIKELPALRAKGVDIVACLSVNDAWVMKAWAEAHDALGKIVMLADGNGEFTRAMGLDVDLSIAGLGSRSQRYAAILDDGVITSLDVEPNPGVVVSKCENILAKV